MWVIKEKFNYSDNGNYFSSMKKLPSGRIAFVFYDSIYAFRFPDEQTAQAVLKFLNRDNLEVVSIDHPGSNS